MCIKKIISNTEMQKYFFLQHFYFNFKRKIDDDIILFYIRTFFFTL